jgi:hypothetical protein
MWCVAKLDDEYIRRMEDVLALYEKPFSGEEPVVCIDEKPVVLHQDTRTPRPARPGQLGRRDYDTNAVARPMFFAAWSPRRGGIFSNPRPRARRQSLPITFWRWLPATPMPEPFIWFWIT